MPEGWAVRSVWFGLSALLLGLLSRLTTVADLDMWHEMALFREALAAGRLPQNDVFAYTPTVSPSVHHEWGTGAVFYLVTVTAGLGAGGLMALKYLLTGAIVSGCLVCARWRGASDQILGPLALLAMPLGCVGFATTMRAQLFTLLFLVFLLLLIEKDREGRRWWVAAWLPAYVVWLNLHGGFVAGLGLFALYTFERLAREIGQRRTLWELSQQLGHLVAAGLGMVVLVTVNPYGLDYVRYLWHAILLDRSLVTEWGPLWDLGTIYMSLYGLSVLTLVYAIAQRGVRNLPGLAFVLVTAYLAFRHFRHLSLYAVVWMCYVPAYVEETGLGRLLKQFSRRRKTFLVVFWVLVGAAGLTLAFFYRFWELRIPTHPAEQDKGIPIIYPAGVVAYMAEQGFTGNVMVHYDHGSFVLWKLYPAVKVSIDSRYEVAYPQEIFEENLDFFAALDGWQETLARYPTDAVLVPRSSPLDQLLEEVAEEQGEKGKSTSWRRVYRDDGFSLFVRAEAAEQLPVIERTGERIPGTFP